jgi:hydroxyethylthiazole kinase-like uncharacterized protein yjeF
MQPDHGPWPIDPATRSWPLHDRAATQAAEQAAQALAAPHALMARAGLAVARLAQALAPHGQRVWVAAGPGNNGGDGLLAAAHLRRAGREVVVSLMGDSAARPADARWALMHAQQAGVEIVEGDDASARCAAGADFVIDALLGIGASRPPAGGLAACIQRINACGAAVLAVDIPSGLNADSGALWGDEAVRASATLALLTLKPGTFTSRGRDHAGANWLHTLGCAAASPTAQLYVPAARAARLHATHKGSHGDVAVVAGAPGMTGAAWLAARAALAAGAGRVYVSLLDDRPPLSDPVHPELMARAHWWLEAPALLGRHTVVCGCGGGPGVAAVLPPLLAHAARLVLDADALNALASDASLAQQLQRRVARGMPTVLTPHPQEAARLLGTTAAQVQNDRLRAAAGLAETMQCAVLLKGSGTVTAAPGLLPCINPSGNAALAGPGTGDVLAGWLAGRWAQQPDSPAQAVAAAAAWEHGHAADRFGGAGLGQPLRASALIEALARGLS